MADWDPVTVKQFDEYLRMLEDRKGRHAGTAEVGDRVETPDKRKWTVVRILSNDQLDLQRGTDETLTVPREFVRVVAKTPRTPEV